MGAAKFGSRIRAWHRHCPRWLTRTRLASAYSWSLSPLLFAARDGRLETARILVSAGADVNQADANGITPLVMAISNNHVDVARFLMDHGADINASDWHGRTPLWAAVETRNMDVDNATFENSVDRAPLFNLIEALLYAVPIPMSGQRKYLPSGARCFVSQAHCHGWTSPVRHLF